MKIDISPDLAFRIRSALNLGAASAAISQARAGSERKRHLAEIEYNMVSSARDAFMELIEAASKADESFAPYQIVAVDDAGGPEGGKLMYYVQNEFGEAVSDRMFSYDDVAAQAQAMANVRRKYGVANLGFVA